jgi:outer membrane protein assembly factor BamB
MNRRSRLRSLAVALLVVAVLFGLQATTAGVGSTQAPAAPTPDAGLPENGTLITVQSYGGFGQNNGKAIAVQHGVVVWEYAPEDGRVFDGEVLDNGNVLASVAVKLPPAECPDAQLQVRSGQCVHNRVVELDPETKEVVWEYDWYDEFIVHHEVHDADRLENGETAIIDMGNNRAFTVAENGTITWQWNASDHLTEGTPFHDEYGGDPRGGPESDWTHMNDIDRLENGNFQLSIRNFDVLVEVDPATNDIVDVVGEPRGVDGNDPIFHEQHNPHRLESAGTVLVADSENDRIVEVDVDTGEVVWTFEGDRRHLKWPRDADRLPNGNTLVTDSQNSRVVEIDREGDVVWEYVVRDDGKYGIPYEADRISLPEEPASNVSGRELASEEREGGVSVVDRARAFARIYLPTWVQAPELTTLAAGLVIVLAIGVDLLGLGIRRARGS